MIPSRAPVLRVAIAALLALATVPADAQTLRLPKLLADGVVLQRGTAIPVWGWAAPNATVTVAFRGATRSARADTAGRWSVRLPQAAAGGPFTLAVTSGGERITLRDVLVGDVWLASGQSNMEWPVAQVTNARAEIAAARDSLLRQFKVPVSYGERPADDVTGGAWVPADPQHVATFSGVAYFFARDLRAAQHVPIGIVNATWGGSAIETWLGAQAQGLPADGGGRALAAEQARLSGLRDAIQARIGPVPDRDPGLVGGRAVWADPALDDAAWTTVRVPAAWEGQGFADVDGVAWYRTTFALTEDEAAQPVTLALGAIDDDDVTWVNGVQVGRTGGAGAIRSYAVPASALRAGPNVLAIRVTDYAGGGGIVGGPPPALTVGGGTRPLAGPWKLRVGELAVRLDGQRLNKVPAITYNRMIHPLLPFPIRGVIWYQGESNAGDQQARAYRGQFRALITSWRAAWRPSGSAPTLPFLWVQLPNYGRPDSVPTASGGGWAVLRESMAAALALPNTGQAVTIDVGGATELHPPNKQDPGRRLALVARRVAYGERVAAAGPTYRAHTVRGSRVTVTFDHARGLTTTAPDGSVGAFAVAGADRRWVWARARVEGDRVVVWSDEVPAPVAVRYAWSNSPVNANLYNGARLPAAPFRTDRW
jgi:sialate O-acetylesterase